MSRRFRTLNALWSHVLIDTLHRHGLTHVIVCPGSRSTPLVIAAAEHPGTTTRVHFDERGAGYYAVGYARATGRPAAVITTSGTAVANLLPAVVEASQDGVPILLLTADRPPELRHTGANQTIDQPGLFGPYARWCCDLPCPDRRIPVRFVVSTAREAVRRSLAPPPGPVHLNCMFREPLVPTVEEDIPREYLHDEQPNPPDRPMSTPDHTPDPVLIDSTIDRLRRAERLLIVAGRLHTEDDRAAALALAQAWGCPLLPDITSGLRLRHEDEIIPYYDLLLAAEDTAASLAPDTVLHVGGRLTSKRLQQWLEQVRPPTYIHLWNDPRRLDPGHIVTDRICADIASTCGRLSIAGSPSQQKADTYLPAWRTANATVQALLSDEPATEVPFTEAAAVRAVLRELPAGHGLFVASSMPVRWADMYAEPCGHTHPTAANRGASGIDGTLASAIGFAEGLARPVTCLLGDQAMLHDLNSLALLRESRYPVTVVLLNNGGGGIFHLLPTIELAELFEPYFVAAHERRFEHAAALFDLPYAAVHSLDELGRACRTALESNRSSLVELLVDRHGSHDSHRRTLARIAAELDHRSPSPTT